jgi:hypothetical protein
MDMMKEIVGPNSSHDNTLSGGPSTSAPSITNLYRNVLSVVLDYLDPRELIRFVRTTQKALSSAHHYFGDLDKTVDFPDPSTDSIHDALAMRELIIFSKSSKKAWSLVHHYFGHQDKKVDLSDLSMPETITDDSLKLFSKCKDINLWGCYQITDVGLAHLKEVTSINLGYCPLITNVGLTQLSQVTSINLWGSQITNAGLAQFKILNPTCKIYGK